MWSMHTNIFSTTFYVKEPIALIVYSNTLVLKCTKWIKSSL